MIIRFPNLVSWLAVYLIQTFLRFFGTPCYMTPVSPTKKISNDLSFNLYFRMVRIKKKRKKAIWSVDLLPENRRRYDLSRNLSRSLSRSLSRNWSGNTLETRLEMRRMRGSKKRQLNMQLWMMFITDKKKLSHTQRERINNTNTMLKEGPLMGI